MALGIYFGKKLFWGGVGVEVIGVSGAARGGGGVAVGWQWAGFLHFFVNILEMMEKIR